VLAGFFAQLYRPAAGAVLVDAVPAELRLTAFTLLRLAINLGMAVGPAIGGLLSALSYWYLFAADAFTCVVFGVLVLALLPETGPAADPVESTVDTPPAATGYRAVFADPALRMYVLSMIAATYVYAQSAGPAAGGLLYAVSPAEHWTVAGAVSVVAAGLILRARPAAPAGSRVRRRGVGVERAPVRRR
jgi:hypothetical protein